MLPICNENSNFRIDFPGQSSFCNAGTPSFAGLSEALARTEIAGLQVPEYVFYTRQAMEF